MSIRLPPAATNASSCSCATSSVLSAPKVIVPSARLDTAHPLDPSMRYSIHRMIATLGARPCSGGVMMRTTFLAFAAAPLVAAPAASAHPGTRGFERTYPHAPRLCAKVANGHAPKRLAASPTQVAGACAALRSNLTAV